MSDQLYDAWSDACDRVRELEQQLAESENLRAGVEFRMDCANAEAVRLRQQLAELFAKLDILEGRATLADVQREELKQQLTAFHQVAEVVKNTSGQIRIVNLDGSAFGLYDNVGLKLYANNNRDDAAH